MSSEDEPSVVTSPRRSRPKAAPAPQAQPADSAGAQEVKPDLIVDAAPPPVSAPDQSHLSVPALEAMPLPLGEMMDAHGFVMGDMVWYWMTGRKDGTLEPHPAILRELLSNGAWRGGRFEAITQGYYVIQAMRYSETPLLGHFSKRATKVS